MFNIIQYYKYLRKYFPLRLFPRVIKNDILLYRKIHLSDISGIRAGDPIAEDVINQGFHMHKLDED